MSKIFLVNVGANSSYRRLARSPIFPNGDHELVTFPCPNCSERYPKHQYQWVREPASMRTHLDPDLKNFTYGDNCSNRRAYALRKAEPGDTLLFWAMLWQVGKDGEGIWSSSEHGWYLIGAIRIQAILESGEQVTSLPKRLQTRTAKNAHIQRGKVEGNNDRFIRLFIGDRARSKYFSKAVDLQVGKDNGLLRSVVRTADGRRLEWDRSPKWNSATRPCRPILDTDEASDKSRIRRLRDAIRKANPDFDLLDG